MTTIDALIEQSSTQDATWISLLAVLVSLTAVIVGPVVQLVIAKRQIAQAASAANAQVRATMDTATLAFRAEVLSTNRQVWINGLREALAQFFAQANYIWMRWSKRLGSAEGITADEMALELKELTRIENQIILMLNPTEEDHDLVRQNLDKVHDLLKSEEIRKGPSAMEAACLELQECARPLLKREWERVKRGE